MSTTAVQSHLTPDEYLALERKATIKSEYLNGQMYAMSGATREHNLVYRSKTAQSFRLPVFLVIGNMHK